MLTSLAVVSLFASIVVAQQTPLIPSGLSTKCSDFMNTLNKDTSLSPCIGSLISATSAFAPGGSASASAVTSALGNMCTESTKCSEPTVRATLAKFSASCNSELNGDTAQAKDLILLYDYVYTLIPFRNAVCSKDDDGSWCAASVGQNVEATSKSNVENYLVDKNKSSVNGTTFGSANIAFGLLQPSLSAESLCKTCPRNILNAFLNFMSNTPHAVGLDKSVLLSGQKSLLDSVDTKCGADFFGGSVQAAGGISAGFGAGNAAVSSSQSNLKTLTLALLSVVTLAIL